MAIWELRVPSLSLLTMWCLLQGISAEAKPDTTSAAELQAKAARGYVKEELELAANYCAGRGAPKDLTQAAYWYRKAADQGNPAAQRFLGYMYTVGLGVPANKGEAVRWYQRAASANDSEAKVNLAALYLRGDGVKQDNQEALRLLHSAAEKGDGRADAYLGLASYMGLGIRTDHEAAEAWFRIGAKEHDPEAEFLLAVFDGNEPGRVPDFANEAKLLRRSAAAGYVPAIHGVGILLVNHPDLPQAPQEGTNMLMSAAKAGFWRSSAVLGLLARDGQLVTKDQRAAYRWYRIAVLQGGTAAETYLHPELQRLARSVPDPGSIEQEAAAWLQMHPDHDLFVFADKMSPRYFPIQEVYATAHARVDKEVGNQTEQPN